MQDTPAGQSANPQGMDHPSSVAAIFPSEAEGLNALVRLHDAGFKSAWLGVTRALKDGVGFSEVVREVGGGRMEQFVRLLSGNGGESLYNVLTNHGVADDVSRHLAREMPEDGIIVIAGWTGDIMVAAQVLEEAGGRVIHGADRGVVGTPRLRLPAEE